MAAAPAGKILGIDVGRHLGYCLEFPEAQRRPPVLACDVVCAANANEAQLRDGATASLDRFLAPEERRLGAEDVVVVERQVRQNERCRRLEQHLVSYFYFRFPDPAARPRLVVQSARLKGLAHGAPRVRGPELKAWAVRTVEEILRARGLAGLLPAAGDGGGFRPSRQDKREDVADAYLTVSAFRATGGRLPPAVTRRPRSRCARPRGPPRAGAPRAPRSRAAAPGTG